MSIKKTTSSALWSVVAAQERASRVQGQLRDFPIVSLCSLLQKTMDFYLSDMSDYEHIADMSGTSVTDLWASSVIIKSWCRDLWRFYSDFVAGKEGIAHQTSPVMVVLPSNGDDEVVYVLSQVFLSRNAAVIRPSSHGSSSYTTAAFVEAFCRAVDDSGRAEWLFLKEVYSVVHLDGDYIPFIAADNWQYIVFGRDETVRQFRQKLYASCTPRQVIGFGGGLSVSIVTEGADWQHALEDIVRSVVFYRGNACICTDVMYVHDSVGGLTHDLDQRLSSVPIGDPRQPGNMGCVSPDNRDYVVERLFTRGFPEPRLLGEWL